MPPSIADYKARLAQKHQETIHQSQMSGETMMGILKTAAVSFDHLTGSDEWNRFLSMIQGKLEDKKREREALLLLCGGAVGPALDQARLGYQFHDGFVKALEEVALFPSQVMGIYRDMKKDTHGGNGA